MLYEVITCPAQAADNFQLSLHCASMKAEIIPFENQINCFFLPPSLLPAAVDLSSLAVPFTWVLSQMTLSVSVELHHQSRILVQARYRWLSIRHENAIWITVTPLFLFNENNGLCQFCCWGNMEHLAVCVTGLSVAGMRSRRSPRPWRLNGTVGGRPEAGPGGQLARRYRL